MWHRYVVLLVAVACMCMLVHAQSDLYPVRGKRNTAKYCSTYLTEALAAVCQGQYNKPTFKKSYDGGDAEDYGFGQQDPDDTRLAFPFRPRPNANSLIPGTFRRFSRGIVDECCRKACSTSELRTYCLSA